MPGQIGYSIINCWMTEWSCELPLRSTCSLISCQSAPFLTHLITPASIFASRKIWRQQHVHYSFSFHIHSMTKSWSVLTTKYIMNLCPCSPHGHYTDPSHLHLFLVLVQKTHSWLFFYTKSGSPRIVQQFLKKSLSSISCIYLLSYLSSCLLKRGLKCAKPSLPSLLFPLGNVLPDLCNWCPLILGIHLKCPLPSYSLLIIPGHSHLITLLILFFT